MATKLTDKKIEQLVSDMARPVLVLRMANGALAHDKYGRHGKTGALTRRHNAIKEIRQLIEEATQ